MDTWLGRLAASHGIDTAGTCIDPLVAAAALEGPIKKKNINGEVDELESSSSSSSGGARSLEEFVIENPAVNLRALLLPPHKCCYGHASNDRLYTSYDPSDERSEVQGPTNAEVRKFEESTSS